MNYLKYILLLTVFLGLYQSSRGVLINNSEQESRKWILNKKVLIDHKLKIEAGQHPSLSKAYKLLIRDANNVLQLSPVSVMDKTLIAASNDKHDYFSFGPYWWPNPEKPNGLPYIRKDGVRNPITSSNGTDKPSKALMKEAVSTLSIAYFFSDDEKYAKHAIRFIETWFINESTLMNPNMEYSQAIPGRVDGRGIGIIESRGFIDVAAAVDLLKSSAYWTPSIDKNVHSWYTQFLNWMVHSENGQTENKAINNHGTWYDCQVAYFAYFDNNDSLARSVINGLGKRMEEQLEADGSQPLELARTRSLNYSVFNLKSYLLLARLAKSLDIDIWKFENSKGATLKTAVDFIGPYADPNKAWPYEQISEFDRQGLASILIQTSLRYPDEDKYQEWLRKIPKNDEVDVPISYADYYYLESLIRKEKMDNNNTKDKL